jgi:hypothetical protein
MNKSPAFQFYPDKWESHTRHLSDLAYRIYHEMLCWMWQHGPEHCQMTATPQVISLLLNKPVESIKLALSEIQHPSMPLLKKLGKVYISGGLKKEAEKQAVFSQKQSDRAKSRWDKEQDVCRGTAAASRGIASAMPDREGDGDGDGEDLFLKGDCQGEIPAVALTFPVIGGSGTWDLTESQLEKFKAVYGERLDVLFECQKSLVWVESSPNHRKTPKGMNRFLVGWLNKATDKSPGKKPQKVDIAVPSQTKTGDYF